MSDENLNEVPADGKTDEELLVEQIDACNLNNTDKTNDLSASIIEPTRERIMVLDKYEYMDDEDTFGTLPFVKWLFDENADGDMIRLKTLETGPNYNGSWGKFEFPLLIESVTISRMKCSEMKLGDAYVEPKVTRDVVDLVDPNPSDEELLKEQIENCEANNIKNVNLATDKETTYSNKEELFLGRYPYYDGVDKNTELDVHSEWVIDKDSNGSVLMTKRLVKKDDTVADWGLLKLPIDLMYVTITPMSCTTMQLGDEYKEPTVTRENVKTTDPNPTDEELLAKKIEECEANNKAERSRIIEEHVVYSNQTLLLGDRYPYSDSANHEAEEGVFVMFDVSTDDEGTTTILKNLVKTPDSKADWGVIEFPLTINTILISPMACSTMSLEDEYTPPNVSISPIDFTDPNPVEPTLEEQIESCNIENQNNLSDLVVTEKYFSYEPEMLLGKYEYIDNFISEHTIGVYSDWSQEDKEDGVVVLTKNLYKGDNYDGSWGKFEFPLLIETVTITPMKCSEMKLGDEYKEPAVARVYETIVDPNEDDNGGNEGGEDGGNGEIDLDKFPIRCDVDKRNAPHPSADVEKLTEYYAKSTICRGRRYPVIMPNVKTDNKE